MACEGPHRPGRGEAVCPAELLRAERECASLSLNVGFMVQLGSSVRLLLFWHCPQSFSWGEALGAPGALPAASCSHGYGRKLPLGLAGATQEISGRNPAVPRVAS